MLVAIMSVLGVSLLTLGVSLTMLTESNYEAELAKNIETREKIATIVAAIERFVIEEERLPCPADPAMRYNNDRSADGGGTFVANFGREALTQSATDGYDCEQSYGAVPVSSLKLDPSYISDASGNRFTYHVSPNLCGNDGDVAPPPANEDKPYIGCTARDFREGINLDGSNPNGNITVKDGGGSDLTTTAAFVIISHGKNGYGAHTPSGVKITADENYASANEIENSDNDLTYVSASYDINNFDDIIYYRTKDMLENSYVFSDKPIIPLVDCIENDKALEAANVLIASHLSNKVRSTRVDDGTTTCNTGVDDASNCLNAGDDAVLGILWTLQEACHQLYPTAQGSWTATRRCPAGMTYDVANNYCDFGS